MRKFLRGKALLAAALSTTAYAYADDEREGGHTDAHAAHHDAGARNDHAHTHDLPIGVMMGHRHKKGEVMLSYRYMNMEMDGSRVGTNSISPEDTATSIANPFFGQAGQPPTLRVVPTRMKMEMHMAGAMYGLTDRVTLMAMGSYADKEMDHTTFAGGMGTDVLGNFTTRSSGFGDTTLGAIIGLDDGRKNHRQINLGLAVSLPTGSISETDQILTPTGVTPSPRLPYPMQLGSGSFDFKPSLVGFDQFGKWSIGGQAMANIRLERNSADYSLGDIYEATSWLAYHAATSVSVSGRIKARTQGTIRGQDALIAAPVQTADPNNQGGDVVEILGGINYVSPSGLFKGHRLAAEFGIPLYRNLNGPQLETDFMFTLGWQKAFN